MSRPITQRELRNESGPILRKDVDPLTGQDPGPRAGLTLSARDDLAGLSELLEVVAI